MGARLGGLHGPRRALRADSWAPHVSLAYEPRILEAAPRIAEAMRAGRLPTTLEVDNLSVIEEQPHGHDRVIEVPFAH